MAIKGAQGVCFNKERNIEWQGADINFQVYLIERGKERRRRRAREERKWGEGMVDGDRKREESVRGEGGESGLEIC